MLGRLFVPPPVAAGQHAQRLAHHRQSALGDTEELRCRLYRDAVIWLTAVADGRISPDVGATAGQRSETDVVTVSASKRVFTEELLAGFGG